MNRLDMFLELKLQKNSIAKQIYSCVVRGPTSTNKILICGYTISTISEQELFIEHGNLNGDYVSFKIKVHVFHNGKEYFIPGSLVISLFKYFEIKPYLRLNRDEKCKIRGRPNHVDTSVLNYSYVEPNGEVKIPELDRWGKVEVQTPINTRDQGLRL